MGPVVGVIAQILVAVSLAGIGIAQARAAEGSPAHWTAMAVCVLLH